MVILPNGSKGSYPSATIFITNHQKPLLKKQIKSNEKCYIEKMNSKYLREVDEIVKRMIVTAYTRFSVAPIVVEQNKR